LKNKILALGKKYLKTAEYDIDKLIMLVQSKLDSNMSLRLVRSILTPLIESNIGIGNMKRCEKILFDLKEGMRDSLEKEFGKLVSQGGALVNKDKTLAVGYSHRGAQHFKIGDKLFDASWKGDHTDAELEKINFIDRGSKTIKSIEDAIQAAKNFQDYIS